MPEQNMAPILAQFSHAIAFSQGQYNQEWLLIEIHLPMPKSSSYCIETSLWSEICWYMREAVLYIVL